MNPSSLLRNPVYRCCPQVVLRRSIGQWYRPKPNALFHTTLLWGDACIGVYDEDMGRSQWRYGLYDFPTCEVMARLLQPGQFAIDIGANIGQMTLLMARAVGHEGRVDSFEPHPMIHDLLRRNIQSSPFGHVVTAHARAVSDRQGPAILRVPADYHKNIGVSSLEPDSHANETIEVERATLDALFGGMQEVDLLKVDVEGHEVAVFRGASGILHDKTVRCVVFEQRSRGQREATAFLEQCDYHVFAINGLEGFLKRPLCPVAECAEFMNLVAFRDISDADRVNTYRGLAIRRLGPHRKWRIVPPGKQRHG